MRRINDILLSALCPSLWRVHLSREERQAERALAVNPAAHLGGAGWHNCFLRSVRSVFFWALTRHVCVIMVMIIIMHGVFFWAFTGHVCEIMVIVGHRWARSLRWAFGHWAVGFLGLMCMIMIVPIAVGFPWAMRTIIPMHALYLHIFWVVCNTWLTAYSESKKKFGPLIHKLFVLFFFLCTLRSYTLQKPQDFSYIRKHPENMLCR
jgi:hypothetical protein